MTLAITFDDVATWLFIFFLCFLFLAMIFASTERFRTIAIGAAAAATALFMIGKLPGGPLSGDVEFPECQIDD